MTCRDCTHKNLCENRCRNIYENGECEYCYHRYYCEALKGEAEKCPYFFDESLVVKLPCNVGDTVYFITGIHRNIVKSARVEEIIINDFGVSDLFVSTDNCSFENSIDIFYFTKTEAEKALKEREHDDL